MTVGSGYEDALEPGGEWAGAVDNTPLTITPFGTEDGIIGLFGEDYNYDGFSLAGTISAWSVATSGVNVRLTAAGITWPAGCRLNLCWLCMTTGVAEGRWFRISSVDAANHYIYLQGETAESFGDIAAGDAFEIGGIHCDRDFMAIRPSGSMSLKAISCDHIGADGTDTDSARALLFCRTFSQGARPQDPMDYLGETAFDETALAGVVRWKRIGSSAGRGSRIRFRLRALVRDRSITVREVRIQGNAWPR